MFLFHLPIPPFTCPHCLVSFRELSPCLVAGAVHPIQLAGRVRQPAHAPHSYDHRPTQLRGHALSPKDFSLLSGFPSQRTAVQFTMLFNPGASFQSADLFHRVFL